MIRMEKKEIEALLQKLKSGIGKSELKIPVKQKGKADVIFNRSEYTALKRLMRLDNVEFNDVKFKSLEIPESYVIDREKIALFEGFPPKYWEQLLTGYDGKNVKAIRKKVQATRGVHEVEVEEVETKKVIPVKKSGGKK